MTRPWRLSEQAESTLTDIARWTVEVFGERQSERYCGELMEMAGRIAAGTAVTYSCRASIDPGLDGALRFSRCGEHFIVFAEMDDGIVVIDFVHSRQDVPRRLRGYRISED